MPQPGYLILKFSLVLSQNGLIACLLSQTASSLITELYSKQRLNYESSQAITRLTTLCTVIHEYQAVGLLALTNFYFIYRDRLMHTNLEQ